MTDNQKYRCKPPACQAEARTPRVHPGVLGLGLLLGGAAWTLGTYGFAWLATHPLRVPVRRPPDDDLLLHDLSFPARDGVRIAGWFAPAPDARGGVILCHGHPMNRMEMLPWARLLHAAGLHTLSFDFRAMGESEGDLCTIGYHEVSDLLGAADCMVDRPEMAGLSLGVFGISMGGAVSILAAAHDERFAAVATHGAYASLDRAIRQRGRVLLGPAGPLLSHAATYWGRRWIPIDPLLVSPLDVISQIAPRPVLLAHGRWDRLIHPSDVEALYVAAGQPKTLYILPNSWHTGINTHDRPAYEALLQDFFLTNL